MKINFTWVSEMLLNEIMITAHPENRSLIMTLEKQLNQKTEITVIDSQNNRSVLLQLNQILSFETLGHVAKVKLSNGKSYIIQKKLKDLSYLENEQFYRINNSQILNLNEIESFGLGNHARLEVTTKTGMQYIVSRHYAKLIKERLSC